MNIVVFGATGGTGRHVLDLAAEAGHSTVAFARDPLALVDARPHSIRQGDVLDPDAVARAVEGADAVVSALGIGYSRAATTVYSAGTDHILKAMRAAGVGRVLCVSTTSMGPPPWRAAPFQRALTSWVLHPMLRRPYADMARMERLVLEDTGLDWTLVRAARLTGGRARGRYRTGVGSRLPGAWSISRADLAHYLVGALAEPSTHRAVVEIAY
ncbi:MULTISPECIES: NAD(P)H-binding protein [unclassified Streptomyces]|uniref:NAD(P)-dependent oxidoreductase n=1 Tax=Streptomycetaceae TaxID=2062 RepID=UPI002E797D46|nr:MULTISPECIES: NAD(P)H-binding protein [unclassified Streptomyces]MED7951256.1 NAD(P)H-binding protein [Streptomyces sp. BE303]MEE1826443.1 NAD(P)H-binding protein [Streptomyces sp. BE20]